MTKFAAFTLSAVLLMTLGSVSPAQAGKYADRASRPALTLRVYNYARVNHTTLKGAEKVAGEVFRQAGIETSWLHCALNQEELAENPVCEQDWGPDSLMIRLVPELLAHKLSPRSAEFGLALVFEHESFETDAYAFYHRAEDLAESGVATVTMILGHVLAHEMGHLLLGVGQHSSSGLMKANWKEKDLRLASTGAFVFTPKQAQRIRADVEQRIAAVESAPLLAAVK